MLDVRDVSVAFDGTPVLDNVSLAVEGGEIVALLGPSGSGKSTLLRVVAGLIPPDAGSVWINGDDVTATPTHRRSVGMVFQDEQLFPHLSVGDNVSFGLKMAGVDKQIRTRRVSELLDLVGLQGFADRGVSDLSGGEAKRVALARSLAPEPRVLLLDEPLTGLDRELHDRLAVEVGSILRRVGTTAVWVTHDHEEAAVVTERIETIGDHGDLAARPSRASHYGAAMDAVEIGAADTHDLRRRVLRNGTPSSDVKFDGDDDPTTFHLGVRDDAGAVVAISTWLERPHPDVSDLPAFQLRGMATEPKLHGSGIGSRLLDAGVDLCVARGGEVVWAHARSTALDFYLRHGFATIGNEYIDATTGLAHIDVLQRLIPPTTP